MNWKEMFFGKKKRSCIFGKYVKYSKETAKINKEMIINEFKRLIEEKNALITIKFNKSITYDYLELKEEYREENRFQPQHIKKSFKMNKKIWDNIDIESKTKLYDKLMSIKDLIQERREIQIELEAFERGNYYEDKVIIMSI